MDEKSTVVRPVRIARAPTGQEIACLEVIKGARVGELIPLTTGANLIGRTANAQLCFDDDGVSRQHAKVSVSEDGIVTVLDLDSTNGSWVNGRRVDMEVLREGDRLDVGPDVQLRLLYRPPQQLQAPDPVARAAEIGLSPRELEVAVRVAEGLTSQEIAKELHISARTVSKHLGNVYERLGLSGRADLTRLVVQRGLLR